MTNFKGMNNGSHLEAQTEASEGRRATCGRKVACLPETILVSSVGEEGIGVPVVSPAPLKNTRSKRPAQKRPDLPRRILLARQSIAWQ